MATPGIRPVQTQACLRAHGRGASCRCAKSYEAFAWDKREGKKVRKTFSGERAFTEAKAWRDSKTIELRQPKRAPAPGMQTIREAGEAWLVLVESGQARTRKTKVAFKPSTARGYRRAFETYIYPDFGPVKLNELRDVDVQAMIERLLVDGLAGQTVRNVVTALQSFYWHHRRTVRPSPCLDLDLPEGGGTRELFVSARDAVESIAALPESDQALWATALLAGLRLGELRALRVCDVELNATMQVGGDDLPVHSISVERSWDPKAGPVNPKSRAGTRPVPVPETLRALLAAHIERTGRSGEDLIFARNGNPRAPFTDSHARATASAAWDKADLKRAEDELEPLQRFGFHDCRGCYRTYLGDIPELHEPRPDWYLGHANTSMGARYTKKFQQQLGEDARRIDNYVTGRTAGKVVELAEAAAR